MKIEKGTIRHMMFELEEKKRELDIKSISILVTKGDVSLYVHDEQDSEDFESEYCTYQNVLVADLVSMYEILLTLDIDISIWYQGKTLIRLK